MSDVNTAASGDFDEVETSDKATSSNFESKVNAAVAEMKQNAEGLWIVPEGLPEEVAFAAGLEKRRRDTQSAFAKSQQRLKALEAETTGLKKSIADKVKLNISVAEAEELEDLKTSDPDEWRKKLGDYEERTSAALKEELDGISSEASEQSELERRAQVLADFLDANPGLVLNDEVFANDLPQGITGKLANGEVSFDDFLEEAKAFLSKGKVIKDTQDIEAAPNLGKAGGRDNPSNSALQGDLDTSYKDVIF